MSTTTTTTNTETEERTNNDKTNNGGPVWDPVAQIYMGGQVPENAQVQEMIAENGGSLRVFGYGSLCWKPGGILAHPKVTSMLGKAQGYRRCWAQKSTDHRGVPRFPGLVCTLLKEEEVQEIRRPQGAAATATSTASAGENGNDKIAMTEGVLYVVPPDLVDECLAELDFREKGGYARDVIEVIEDDTGNAVHALLYRGTPDNPAMWPRALRDLPYAAAILSVSIGPSGRNDEYLKNLNDFLEHSTEIAALREFDDTIELAAMVRNYQQQTDLFFLYGVGSNQHNQLLLNSDNDKNKNVAELVNGGEDAHQLKEILLCVPKQHPRHEIPKQVFAGGGHSAVLTLEGRLYLFGWSERGQCGPTSAENSVPSPVVAPLIKSSDKGWDELRVETCALGFHHTLLIERTTGQLWALGDNSRGQADGKGGANNDMFDTPTKVPFLEEERVVEVACGLYHSAAITANGELVVFGCGRFGQTLSSEPASGSASAQAQAVNVARWKPDNRGSNVQKVACGRRHTIALDEAGHVYAFGDNKYGQLGIDGNNGSDDKESRYSTPQRVGAPWEDDGFTAYDIDCGWSHTIVLVRRPGVDKGFEKAVYGWGRNDKGQLGVSSGGDYIHRPTLLFGVSDHAPHRIAVQHALCGSEYTLVVDQDNDGIWGCGWNEHGNLGQNHDRDMTSLVQMTGQQGAATIANPLPNPEHAKLCVAAGGAHVLALRVA